MKPAADVLRMLRVRPGMQRTTHVYRDYPLVTLDFEWREGDFQLVLSWPLHSKCVAVPDVDVETRSKGHWSRDKTYRLTESAIARLAPGLEALVSKILGR